ncbi:MAG: alpha/beta hydrolase [Acidobacteriota bacterium]
MHLTLLVIAVSVLSMVAGVAIFLSWVVPQIERRFIFRPSSELSQSPQDVGIAFQDHFFESSDGCRLHAWHLCPPQPMATAIYFHGNSINLGLYVEIFRDLYAGQVEIFAVDYRGYGRSSGVPSEKGLYRDALATVEYFKNRVQRPGEAGAVPLLYWGRSLGGTVAAFAAGKIPPDGLILETAFPSKKAMLADAPQARKMVLFSRCRLDTVGHLRRQQFPVLVLHGNRDKAVPLEQGRLLFEQLPGPKELCVIEGGDHMNIHLVERSRYMSTIRRFAERCGAGFRREGDAVSAP